MPDRSSRRDDATPRQELPHQRQLTNQQFDNFEQLFRDLEITADLARGHGEPAPSNKNRHRAHVGSERKGGEATSVSNGVQGSTSKESETQRSYADVTRGSHVNQIQSSRSNSGRVPLSHKSRTTHLSTTTASVSSDPQIPQNLQPHIQAITSLRQNNNRPRNPRRNSISAAFRNQGRPRGPTDYPAPPVNLYGPRNHHSSRHPSHPIVSPQSKISTSKNLHNLIIRRDSKAPVPNPTCSIQVPSHRATSHPASAPPTDPSRTPSETLKADRISTTQQPGVRATLLAQDSQLSLPVRPTSPIIDRALALRRAEMDSVITDTPEFRLRALIPVSYSNLHVHTSGSINGDADKDEDRNGGGVAVKELEEQEGEEEEEDEESEAGEEGFEIIETWDEHLSGSNEAVGPWYRLWRQ